MDEVTEKTDEKEKAEIATRLDAEIGECLDADDTALLEEWAFELDL